MNRKAFHQLLRKYVDGKCTADEKQLIDQWYKLLDDNSLLPSSESEIKNIEERLWQKIQSSIYKDRKPSKIKYLNFYKALAAACLIGIVCTAIYFYHPSTPKKEVSFYEEKIKKGLSEINNKTAGIEKVMLEDSSEVLLQPGAGIAFPKKFAADKREVYLDGVAFFKVSKNPERPFYVYDDNIVTQVLGTTFTMKKVDGEIEVDVLTGRVAVYENNASQNHVEKTNGVVITPNQKVIYYAKDRQFVTALVEKPVPVIAENKINIPVQFVYEDALVATVLDDLQNEYKIQIIVENEKINHCYFTGDITEQSLYNKLGLLCQAIQANYEIRGTSIVINGKGCN